LQGPGDSIPTYSVHRSTSIWRCDRDVGFHAAFKGSTRTFLGQPETYGDTFERTTGFVRQPDGDGTFALRSSRVNGSFAVKNLNSE
jgi:hypothetical protein